MQIALTVHNISTGQVSFMPGDMIDRSGSTVVYANEIITDESLYDALYGLLLNHAIQITAFGDSYTLVDLVAIRRGNFVAHGTIFPIESLVEGDRFFRTDLGSLYTWDGTSWLDLGPSGVGPHGTDHEPPGAPDPIPYLELIEPRLSGAGNNTTLSSLAAGRLNLQASGRMTASAADTGLLFSSISGDAVFRTSGPAGEARLESNGFNGDAFLSASRNTTVSAGGITAINATNDIALTATNNRITMQAGDDVTLNGDDAIWMTTGTNDITLNPARSVIMTPSNQLNVTASDILMSTAGGADIVFNAEVTATLRSVTDAAMIRGDSAVVLADNNSVAITSTNGDINVTADATLNLIASTDKATLRGAEIDIFSDVNNIYMEATAGSFTVNADGFSTLRSTASVARVRGSTGTQIVADNGELTITANNNDVTITASNGVNLVASGQDVYIESTDINSDVDIHPARDFIVDTGRTVSLTGNIGAAGTGISLYSKGQILLKTDVTGGNVTIEPEDDFEVSSGSNCHVAGSGYIWLESSNSYVLLDAANSFTEFVGGLVNYRVDVTATTTLANSHHMLSVAAVATAIDVTTSPTPNDGQTVEMKAIDITKTVRLVPNAGQTLEGAGGHLFGLNENYKAVYNSTTSNWEKR
jgi:uncharacterized protein (DUF2345 family)